MYFLSASLWYTKHMQESSRYAVGIDIGTTTVRCVVGHVDPSTGIPTVVGIGQAPNSGMRKGYVANLAGPAKAIDDALGEAERMSGYEVNEAVLSLNGPHIISTNTDGMIAVGAASHEITDEDIARVEEVATVGKIPPNREIIEVVPRDFRLDGQDGIKDPLGMTGTRLEISANVVSALSPYAVNVRKVADMATVTPHDIVPSVLASAKAVLGEKQLESGVAVIDLGGATTGVAVFEEGDLHYVGVVPIGGMHVTNDLAIGLKTSPETAEEVKVKHATAVVRSDKEGLSVKQGDEILTFDSEEIDEIVEARLEEIFDGIEAELKKAGRAGKLPSGVVLVGGGAKLKRVADYTRERLGMAVTLGAPSGFGGVDERIEQPEFAAAVGLMFADMEESTGVSAKSTSGNSALSGGLVHGIKKVFKKLKF